LKNYLKKGNKLGAGIAIGIGIGVRNSLTQKGDKKDDNKS
jgi:hypothetical protein